MSIQGYSHKTDSVDNVYCDQCGKGLGSVDGSSDGVVFCGESCIKQYVQNGLSFSSKQELKEFKWEVRKSANKLLDLARFCSEEIVWGDCTELITADNNYESPKEHLDTGCAECCLRADLFNLYLEIFKLSQYE